MGPGCKRGVKGLKTKRELSFGDLVLAKIKGFPAWPAKISRPEDWDRAPDPKKYFVQFFGTSEIAFVAPVDIQSFTSESKYKLSARCQGKTVKYFAQAVKEICEEFELLQHKNLSGVRGDNNAKNLASEIHLFDPVVDETLEVSANNGMASEGPNCKLEIKGLSDLGPGLERSPKRLGEMEQDERPCSSDDVNPSLSPHLFMRRRNKLSTNPTGLVKGSVLGFSPSSHIFVMDESSCDDKSKAPDGGLSSLTNGYQPKLAMGLKRKHEGAVRRSSDSVIFREHIGDGLQSKHASGGNMKLASADNSRSDLDTGSERKGKKLLKEKKHSEAVDDGQMDAEATFEGHIEVISRKKMKFQHNHEKQTSRTNEASFSVKIDSKESKMLVSGGKAEHKAFRTQPSSNESNHSTDEDDLPPIKRHRQASRLISGSISENAASHKKDFVHPNKVRSPIMQPPTKRKAVRLCDDDDDELPKTPIHLGFIQKVSVNPRVSDSKMKNVKHGASDANSQTIIKNFGGVEDEEKEQVLSSRASNKASPPSAEQKVEKSIESSAEHVFPSSHDLGAEKMHFVEAKPVILSSKRSPRSITATRRLPDSQKQQFSKVPGSASQKKIPSGSSRVVPTASDRLISSLNQSISERSKPTSSSGEKRKTTPKSDSRFNDSGLFVGRSDERITSLGERLDVGKDTKTSFPVDLTISDSVMSMKHLIAAAQARKRQANLQNSFEDRESLLLPDADRLARSPIPAPASLAVESSNTVQFDVQGRPTSPSYDVRQLSSIDELQNDDLEEGRVSSGHQVTGSSLSGDTDAAVARDAFEGMIETLSRTKESIGRATRLAIDCVKYGIANEVVELLIQKLQNEPSFHRKVDIFFLVDSITQCSHSHKGIAGASYIPTVQAALPRLIGAAAPPGIDAQENRRQCLKVLRLWLERKILPESVLRHYMDVIGAMNDGSSAGFSQRRPSRAERGIDDPIREMEDLFVDEYGSNATFQLPGFLSSHLFEEEEDEDNFPTKLCKEAMDTSPSEHTPASKDSENCTVTPSDRRHCILEDVDGELEMEDVSGHQKDEKPLITSSNSVVASVEPNSGVIFESASNMCELLPSPESSPPYPPGSPPVTPPLPTSPPPPLSSPSPPPPPPPPQPSSSQQHLYAPPPVCPPSLLSLPPQPLLMSRYMPQLPTMSTSQLLAYHQPPFHHEIGSTHNGNQVAYIVSNAQESHIDAPMGSEVFSQQSSFLSQAAVSSGREYVGYNSSRLIEYGQDDVCMTGQALQQRQQFLHGNVPFAQKPLHPELLPQQIPSHFSFPRSVQQHQYRLHSMSKFSDGPRRYATDEQLRMPENDSVADYPRMEWVTGGKSCSGKPNEGYFGPPLGRAPTSAVNLQLSAANNLPSAPVPGDLTGYRRFKEV